MEAQKIAVILLADLISGKDDHVLRIIALNECNVLINRIGRAFIPVGTGCLLIGRQHMNSSVKAVQVPGLSISDILIKYHRLILCQDSYCVNPRIYTVRQREVDNPVFSAKRNCRFCQFLSQGIQA